MQVDKRPYPTSIKLLVTIVNRGVGDKVIQRFSDLHSHFNMILLGHGTARSDIMDLLGLTETGRDVILSVMREENVARALRLLRDEFHLEEPGCGIAFTIPINSVGGVRTLRLIASQFSEEEK